MNSRITPVAPRLRTWLKYCEALNVTTSVPGYAVYSFNLNGLFDPNQTGTGHQPRGYDQLTALYQRYRVYHTKWQVLAQPQNASGGWLGVVPTNAGSPGSFNDLIEQTYATAQAFSQGRPGNMAGSVDLAKLNGKTHTAYMADDTTQALTSANPGENMQLHVGILDFIGAANYGIHVTLWFDCEFSDPLQLNQS